MRCPNCDYELPDGAEICPRCGTNTQEKAPLLIKQPVPSFDDPRTEPGYMQTGVRVWAVIALVLSLFSTLYLAIHYGYQEDVFTYLGKVYSNGRFMVPEIFWPILVGGVFISAGHFILLLAVADALEKLGDIRHYVSRLK